VSRTLASCHPRSTNAGFSPRGSYAAKRSFEPTPDDSCLVLELGAEIDVPGQGTIGMPRPLVVTVGGEEVDLGGMEIWLSDATLVRRRGIRIA
jgi:hypothetical protein